MRDPQLGSNSDLWCQIIVVGTTATRAHSGRSGLPRGRADGTMLGDWKILKKRAPATFAG